MQLTHEVDGAKQRKTRPGCNSDREDHGSFAGGAAHSPRSLDKCGLWEPARTSTVEPGTRPTYDAYFGSARPQKRRPGCPDRPAFAPLRDC